MDLSKFVSCHYHDTMQLEFVKSILKDFTKNDFNNIRSLRSFGYCCLDILEEYINQEKDYEKTLTVLLHYH